MKQIKCINAICMQSLRKWAKDYRIWTIAAIMLVLIHSNLSNLSKISENIGTSSSIWYFPFIYSQYHMKLIFTFPLLLIFCEAPFVDNNSLLIISRSNKMYWTIGHIMYIVVSSAIYYIFILIFTILIALPNSEISTEWGQVIYTVANTDITLKMNISFINASNFVMSYFTPLTAIFFTFILSWLCAIMLGMIVYSLNILTKTKYIGVTVSGALVVYSSFVSVFKPVSMTKYSPVSWITLDNVDVGGKTSNPSFTYCISFYLTVIFTLIILTMIYTKKSKSSLFEMR